MADAPARGPAPGDWRWAAAALALYITISLIVVDHGESLTGKIIGQGDDPMAFIWFVAWWPYALSHSLDPLYTLLLWQPLGLYLPWVASVPLLSLAAAPITWLGGPILSYNLIMLLAPALSALAMYFLCLRLARAPYQAIIGGYLFGFSSYQMAQDTAAPNLCMTLLLPAILLVVLRRLDGALSRRAVIVAGGLLLVAQFMISTEIFAMIFVFGGMAWALAWSYLPDRRPALFRLFLDGLLAGPLVGLAVSPFLLTMARHSGYVHLPPVWPYYFKADVANVFVPSRLAAVGGDWCGSISRHFNGGIQEQDAYISVPGLVIVWLFARENAARPARRMLVVLFCLLLIASFGPSLSIAGFSPSFALPWALFVALPLIGAALPARFALFVSLTLSMIVVLWLSDAVTTRDRRLRLALTAAALVALLPRFHPWETAPHARFFQPGVVQAALGAKARLLVLPFAINGPSSFWQEEAGFSFDQTGGYLGFPPAAMQRFPAVQELFNNVQGPDFLTDLREFCQQTATQYVVAGPGTSDSMMAALDRLDWPQRRIDDVTVYSVPASLGGPADR
jgi:hypothetical protein